MDVTPADVHLAIGRLVLHGVAPADAARLGAAMERELQRLLETRGLPSGLARGASLDEGEVCVPAGAGPEEAGRAAAGAVYRRLGSARAAPGRPGDSGR
ncbi:MAG: hypothetical protein IT208_11530 [Chthonomonadales bacterium]|nr:hypothetical protein [Chthonomonadales bacterium]